jgi:hypothetical protein
VYLHEKPGGQFTNLKCDMALMMASPVGRPAGRPSAETCAKSVSGVLFLSRSLEGGCGRIGPGQELVETALGMAVDDAADHVGQIGPRLDTNQLAGLNQGRNHRPVCGSAVRAGKERILPGQSNLPVILPISGRKSWSIIAGIPSLGVAFASAATSSVSPGGSCRSKRSPASSRL